MDVSESAVELRRIGEKMESTDCRFDLVRLVCEAGIVIWRLMIPGKLQLSSLFDLTKKQSEDVGIIIQRIEQAEASGRLEHRHPEANGFTMKQYFCGALMELVTFRVMLKQEHLPYVPGQRIRCNVTAGPRPEMEKLRDERPKPDPDVVGETGLFHDAPIGLHKGEYVNLHTAEADTYARACMTLATVIEAFGTKVPPENQVLAKHIPPRAQKAWNEYEAAVEVMGIENPLDNEVYEQVETTFKIAAKRRKMSPKALGLPLRDTWLRNLRIAREAKGQQKNKKRDGRAGDAGSIVSQAEID